MKNFLLLIALCGATLTAFSQDVKDIPPSNLEPNQSINKNIKPWFTPRTPTGENPFGVTASPINPLSIVPGIKTITGNEGLPIFFEGIIPGSGKVNKNTAAAEALNYLVALKPPGIQHPSEAFVLKRVQEDEEGNFHVRFNQFHQRIPVFGAEIIAHTRDGVFSYAGGRYAPSPKLETIIPSIAQSTAVEVVKGHIGRDKINSEWTDQDREMSGQEQFETELVIYRHGTENKIARLAWKIEAHPIAMSHLFYFVDAQNGAVLHVIDQTCSFEPEESPSLAGNHTHEETKAAIVPAEKAVLPPPPGPTTGTGLDMFGINRTFGAWLHTNNNHYMVDVTRDMFDGNLASIFTSSMSGVIALQDQQNTPNGTRYYVGSTSSTFTDPMAISAYYHAGLCYEYFKDTHNRNSINDLGGTIKVVINVPSSDGSSMDNAYWSSNTMWFGNGDQVFTPLAKALDIMGHEMGHGVVGATASLIYENQSGALNESYGDIFGMMIDRDDWTMGEEVVLLSSYTTGAMRNLADPHQGLTQGERGWQPSHYSELLIGAVDHGYVHRNSGIPSYAFYLLATDPYWGGSSEAGKAAAESIWYAALRDHLTASSQFIDLRIAVLQVLADDPALAAVAENIFDAVGVTTASGVPTAEAPFLPHNTGKDHVLSVSDNGMNLTLSDEDGTFIEELYTGGVLDRPSVTDNGETVVFVNTDHHIVGVEIAYNSGSDISYLSGIVSEDTIWRNVAISKDGRFLAGLTTLNDNKIIFFDLDAPNGPSPREYLLANPTYADTSLGAAAWVYDVEYADEMEFDYSGTQLIYDAFTHFEGDSISADQGHWEIGVMTFWEDGQYTDNSFPEIRKLVSGLPEQAGIAQPAYSKNANHLITYDYYEEAPGGGYKYYTYIANTETGENAPIFTGHELAYPSFTTKDDKILFQDRSILGGNHLRLQKLSPNQMAPHGNPSNLILGHKWGIWLNNGTRVHTNTTDVFDRINNDTPITVYPNPSNGLVHIQLSTELRTEAKLEVWSSIGQLLIQDKVVLMPGENETNVDLTSLPAGTYFIRIWSDKIQGITQVVKE